MSQRALLGDLTLASPGWRAAPTGLPAAAGEVHVWRAGLNLPRQRFEQLAASLSADERQRAARFWFEKDRRRYIAARGILRELVGGYLGLEPAAVQFVYGQRGKPALRPEAGLPGLRFNLAHSSALALYAFALDREVGVDLEHVCPEIALEQLARRFFSPRENAVLRALPPACLTQTFFAGWTRKEAYLKARGDGLSFPLGSFEVSLAPGRPAELLSVYDDPAEPARWSLRDVFPGAGYVATVAAEGRDWALACWNWSDWDEHVSTPSDE
jgi:4'-phosphopantetheinyl transferase